LCHISARRRYTREQPSEARHLANRKEAKPTLSNLTLLTNGENDRAKNKSYTAKKAIYHDSEYVINKYFDSVDDWSVESAKAWEQYLQEMVCKVFVV
jgi:hypothetical protein